MRRARLLPAALLLALALPAWAQAPPLITWVWPESAANSEACLAAFKAGMQANGLIQGTHCALKRALVLAIAQSVLLRADEVIE